MTTLYYCYLANLVKQLHDICMFSNHLGIVICLCIISVRISTEFHTGFDSFDLYEISYLFLLFNILYLSLFPFILRGYYLIFLTSVAVFLLHFFQFLSFLLSRSPGKLQQPMHIFKGALEM